MGIQYRLDKKLIIIDLEASSVNSSASILQIGAVKLTKTGVFEQNDCFNVFIRPYTDDWTETAEKCHGLSREFLNNRGTNIETTLEQFVSWVGNPKAYYIAQWSCGFDTKLLQSAFSVCGKEYPFSHRSYDIASIVRFYLAKHCLNTRAGLFKSANILEIDTSEFKAHNAAHDAVLTALCFQGVMKRVLDKTNS